MVGYSTLVTNRLILSLVSSQSWEEEEADGEVVMELCLMVEFTALWNIAHTEKTPDQ